MNKVKQWIEQEFSTAEAALQRKRAADDAALKRERADADLNRRRADARERLQTEKGKAARLVAEAERNLSPKPKMPSDTAMGCLLGFLTLCMASILGFWYGGSLLARGITMLLSLLMGFYGIPFVRQISWEIEKNRIMGNVHARADEVARKAQAVYNAEIKTIESSIAP